MAVITGGTIAIDNVKTPKAEAHNLLGGSAAYVALAASYYEKNVHLVGIIGNDFPQQHLDMLEGHQINLAGVERSELASFTWTGEYMENMNDRETHAVALNVLENWSIKVPEEGANAELIVLANMSPESQLEMLEQCTSKQRFVIADTMDLWINIANEPLHAVLTQLDLFVLNESEAQLLAKTPNLIEAGHRLLEKGAKNVIIKLGEFGALLFNQQKEMFRCPAWALQEVTDPTGAGDSFLGAMAGYLSSLNKVNFEQEDFIQAMVRGSVVASFTCEAFSTNKLQDLTMQEINDRLLALHATSSWDLS